MTKYVAREKAIKLRKDGHSYNYIVDKIGVSKGTLNCWLSDILYIREGLKSYGSIRVINANPKVIRFMVKWFKEIFGMSDENFVIRLHLYPDNDGKDCIDFWSRETGLLTSQLQKTQINTRKNKKISKRGKLP